MPLGDGYTSKGSYRSWKKIVKVSMMMMIMKEGIIPGHSSLTFPPLDLAWLALASLALALNPLTILPLHSPLLQSSL